MIIVSQDKKTILNFNNIQDIRIERYTTHEKGKYIYKIFGGNFEGYATEIGIYATEERAKEVLKAIRGVYQANKLLECTSRIEEQNQIIDGILKTGMKPFEFEMPGE